MTGLFAWISLADLFWTYYIPEKRKFARILCFRQQRSRRSIGVSRRVTISLSAR